MKCKASNLIMLALAFTLALVLIAPAQAKKPLIGTMVLDFQVGWLDIGPNDEYPIWVGTITIDDVDYGMRFFNIGPEPKPGKAGHFEEIWEIYTYGDPEDTLLWGYDEGITGPNSKYRMNGVVEEAYGDFAIWDGRNVHMSGDITWQEHPDYGIIPETAPGVFRIN